MSFELLCLVVLAYLVFGPRKLPEMARLFAKTMAEIRRAGNEFRYSLEDEVRKIEAETKAPPRQLEAAPGVAGAVARPDPSAPEAESAAAHGAEPEGATDGAEDEEQWYESDWDWEQDAEPAELAPETPSPEPAPGADTTAPATAAAPPPPPAPVLQEKAPAHD